MLFEGLRSEPDRSEQLFHQFAFDDSVIARRIVRRQHSPRKLSEDRCYLALKTAHSRLTRIELSDRLNALFGKVDLFLRETVCLELLQKQMTPRNLELLALGVARKPDNLEPVLKRRRNRVQHVRRRYEHHIGKIVLNIQRMIVKCKILFRVEYFK